MRARSVVRTFILLVIAISIGVTFYGFYKKDQGSVIIGELAPDFALKTLDGQTIQLSSLKGNGVLLNFWATWCEPCRREMPLMEEKYEILKNSGVEFLAVNIAEPDIPVFSFVDRLGITFPILMDREKIITQLYGVGPLPSTFFIDKEGNVVSHFVGEMNESTINKHLEQIIP
jgi:peroxiredoxin